MNLDIRGQLTEAIQWVSDLKAEVERLGNALPDPDRLESIAKTIRGSPVGRIIPYSWAADELEAMAAKVRAAR